jgi:hypothetical protein
LNSEKKLSLNFDFLMELRSLLWIWSLLLGIAILHSSNADLTYGETCDVSNPCNPVEGLQCIHGLCGCKTPLNMNFNSTLKRCVGLAGTKCEGTNDSSVCHPEYGVCVPDSQSKTGFSCACAQGYSEKFNRNRRRSKRVIVIRACYGFDRRNSKLRMSRLFQLTVHPVMMRKRVLQIATPMLDCVATMVCVLASTKGVRFGMMRGGCA